MVVAVFNEYKAEWSTIPENIQMQILTMHYKRIGVDEKLVQPTISWDPEFVLLSDEEIG
jgi:hypothetical protein